MKTQILFLLLFSTAFACFSQGKYDLAIKNVDLFDSKTKKVLINQTILINADTIASIVAGDVDVLAFNVIEGNGRLATPGFVDTHIHLTNTYGDYEEAPEYLAKDSLTYYRQLLADEFLKYGTTTIRVAGQPENWIKPTLKWQKNPSPLYPDIYISGGALISDQPNPAYNNHVIVKGPEDAAAKIQEYYDLGIEHIKLYSKLQPDDFKAAYNKAEELGLNVCAHVDRNIMSIDTAMTWGMKHFEHTFTLAMSVFSYEQNWRQFEDYFYKDNRFAMWHLDFFNRTNEIFGFIDENPDLAEKADSLIVQMANNQVSVCSTIHFFAESAGTSYFANAPHQSGKPAVYDMYSRKRSRKNFAILMKYTKKLHDAGVMLTIGTDCESGGKAALSEMILLEKAGVSVADILQIATLNGAQVISLDDKYGKIAPGKKANIVLFEKSPFKCSKNFLSEKVIIKDGILYEN